MTARFEPRTLTFGQVRGKRLSITDWIILSAVLAGLTLFSFPAYAQAENKTLLVFEIKSFPAIKIPQPVEAAVLPEAENPIKIEMDPKTGKVYMHEPAIKAYICPKLKDKCKTFIAILKAENGTHECTRDNQGLNKNGSIDVGLAQINWTKHSLYTIEQLRDCKFNLDIAFQKYEARGFYPWVAYTTGRYKKHLKYIN